MTKIRTTNESQNKRCDPISSLQGGPLMHVIAAKAVAFKEALQPDFKGYQRQIVANAKALGDEVLSMGYDLVSGGTDNHLILVDLTRIEVTGKEAEEGSSEGSNL